MNTSSKYLTILLAVAALLLSAACSNDDMDAGVTTEFVSAQVTASINNGEAESRATNTTLLKAEFVEGDVAHVVPGGSSTYYDYTLSSGTWSSDNPYYFQNTSDVTFTAWYASSSTGSESSIAINSANNQASDSIEWCKWDILVAPAVTANYKNPVVSFTGEKAFDHIMSKMTFKFIAGDGISNLSDLSGYSLSNLITEATFYTSNYSLTNGTTTSSISQTISGIADTETSYISAPLILVPQTFSEDNPISIAVTYNGNTYTADIPLTALVAGYHYAFNVTVSNTGLEVSAAEIKDWTSTDEQEGDSYISYTYTETDGVRTYTVYNENGLRTWAEYVNAGNYGTNCKLGSDITMSTSTNWTPVGYYNNDDATAIIDNPYTGTFDGNGKTITNLTINQPYRGCVGLIGYTSSAAVIKDLTLENVTVSSDWGWNVGAVVGMNYGSVSGCNVTGTVSGSGAVGGVVGSNYDNAIIGCYFTGTVTGITGNYDSQGSGVGGVAGANYGNSSSITACYSTGTVSGSYNVGGVVGHETTLVTACYSTATVSGTGDYVGGVIGYKETGTVSACYWYNSSTDYGVGYSGSGSEVDGVTKVSSSSSSDWSTALSAMNTALTSSGWQYETNTDTSSDQPLLLVESSTTSD